MSTTTNGGTFPLKPDAVLRVVADAYGLTTISLKSSRRSRLLDEARPVAYRLLHDECRIGWPAVAEIMGRYKGGWVGVQARKADPDAVAELIVRLHPNGNQEPLFR